MKKLLRLDWDIIAGIAAAVIAIILHLLHIVKSEVIFVIVLVLLALLLFRDLRREGQDEHLSESLQELKGNVQGIQLMIEQPEAILIGPRRLRAETRRFIEAARGELVWFNPCFLMFQSDEVFDVLLRPAIDNPLIDSITFIARENEREHWDQNMASKIKRCSGRSRVKETIWRDLPETISFVLADIEAGGPTEALVSFWGEPFMARQSGQQLPRYVFRIQAHSDLIARLVELERDQRIGAG